MRFKLLFLIIAMILIVPTFTNAVVEWSWNMAKMNQSDFFMIDMHNTTALFSFNTNVSEVGFVATCEHLGKQIITAPWTTNLNPNITGAFPFDEYNSSIQLISGGGGESKVICSEAEGVIDGYILNKKINGGGGNVEFHQGDDATFGATIGWDNDFGFFRYSATSNSNIKIANDQTKWVWARIDSSTGIRKYYLYNFSDYDESTFGAGTITINNIRTANTGGDGVFNRIRIWDLNAARNASANRIQFNPLPLTTSSTSFLINITTNSSTNINASFSCDEGVTFGVGGAINTTISCGSGSATKNPVLRIDFNESSGILKQIKVEPIIIVLPDTEPASMTLINLSSEGGNGQIIYNITNIAQSIIDGKLNGSVRTNDTTPTFRTITNRSATCAIVGRGFNYNFTNATTAVSGSQCATTGGTNHICTTTDSDATNRTGVHCFSIGCKDGSTNANENRTSTSGLFCANITSPNAPNSTLFRPRIDEFFVVGGNASSINFTFFGLIENERDNDRNFTAELLIDEAVQITNSTYLNGTNVTYILNYATTGRHNWSVRMTDSFNNINYSGNRSFEIRKTQNITLQLNGTNDTKKYEYPLRIGLLNGTILINATKVNITILVSDNATSCLTIDDNVNISCSSGNWSYYFNVTELIIDKFFNNTKRINLTESISNISVIVDNRSDILTFTLNLSGFESQDNFPHDISLDFNKDNKSEIVLPGRLRGNVLETNNFTVGGIFKSNHNASLSTGGSAIILINASNIGDISNFSAFISGFDLDIGNEFSYTEHFNNTNGAKGINDTLTFQADVPSGIFDDFVINNSEWNGGTCPLSYGTSKLTMSCGGSNDQEFTYSDAAADLRNSSKIVAYFDWSGGCNGGSVGYKFYVTDGTNKILVSSDDVYVGFGSGSNTYNITLTKASSNYKSWSYSGDGSGTVDLSLLDFDKQISLKWQPFSGSLCSASITLNQINWSGSWLNYSANNGTYKPIGNVTSKVVNVTNKNVSAAVLTATSYIPSGTAIEYYLSNTCNATNPTFESVQNNVLHTFLATGNSVCWRAVMNSTINTTTPVIRKVIVETVASSIRNISIDVGSDGDKDWTFEGILNATTSPKRANITITEFSDYRSANCVNIPICQYPVTFSSSTGGILEISRVNTTIELSNIEINKSRVENLNIINMSIKFLNGILELSGLRYNFQGSKNFTVNATHSISSTLLEDKDSKIIQFKYSKFNFSFPQGIDNFEMQFQKPNATNITIIGQQFGRCNTSSDDYCIHTSTPIFNITNLAYDDPIDIAIFSNNSIDKNINHSFDLGVNRTASIQINDTREINLITNLDVNNGTNSSRGIFAFIDFMNMTWEHLAEINFDYDFRFRAFCKECVR